MAEENLEAQEMLDRLLDICKEQSDKVVSAMAVVLLYTAVKRSVDSGNLPESALTKRGLEEVFKFQAFGNKQNEGVLKVFSLELNDDIKMPPSPKPVMN